MEQSRLQGRVHKVRYQFGLLCIDGITELQKSLELIVLGESDYLHYCAELGENLSPKTNRLY